ncbi:NAD(P)/FAD-dependent oxidoreductase [Myxococcota bacterium]|nr:NAD(P)/FAD-dependent oxidoreductase [Myxococcota bacterium]MCZ7616920.1 NAD(P)/FAD-dependent oxidoreductase [Myxococcota bacterium]
MRFHGEASRDHYDVVVVGSGLGGLTAAALLARAGRRVLVVERHDRVGGYGHAFRRGRYLFDSAVHLVGGCEPVAYEGGGLLHQLLTTLGIRAAVDFDRVDPCYEAVYPDLALRVPCDLEGFVDAHAELFPNEAKGIRQVVQECLSIRLEARRAAELARAFDVSGAPGRFPTLLRYRKATLAEVLEDHIDSPKARALLGTLWPYLGLPPSRVSFLYFATMLMSYVADGAYACRGSFQRFADALALGVRRDSGEVLLRSSVRRILVEHERTQGVVLENGQRIRSDCVLSNVDLLQTVHELVGRERFPDHYVRALDRLTPSLSGFVTYLATDLPLSSGTTSRETFYFPSWDHDAAYAGCRRGLPDWLTVTAPSLSDPSLAPAGEQLLVLTTLVRHDAIDWRSQKHLLADAQIAIADRSIAGLRDHLRFREGASPRTLERYTRNSNGAVYGWELSPHQVGPGRPGNQTPIPGLHLVGHWTQPGGGVYGVVSSGVQTARAVLGLRREAELWETLGSPESAPRP